MKRRLTNKSGMGDKDREEEEKKLLLQRYEFFMRRNLFGNIATDFSYSRFKISILNSR